MTNNPATQHPDLIVGIDTADDAGVIRLREDLALVQTVDYFTPIVDDAFDWGRIAVANALSDVYAMGGQPLSALQIVGWPRAKLPFELLTEVLRGAATVLSEAGCVLLGGHSLDDPEPKFGLAVTGTIDPGQVVTNAGAEPGDAIVLTKAIGTGLIATATKRDQVSPELEAASIASMVALNAAASATMLRVGVNAATDVTGFGLLGHLHEMTAASGVGAVIEASAVPLFDGVLDLAAAGVVPGGTKRNLNNALAFTDFGEASEEVRTVLADAQTSGGLLISASADAAAAIVDELGPPAAVIGTIERDPGIRVA